MGTKSNLKQSANVENNLPECLERGTKARLIPVIKDLRKEEQVVSVLLSTLMTVDELAMVLLGSLGHRYGTRAKLDCFTEVVCKKKIGTENLRPDGFLIFNPGKKVWSALIEAKIGNNELNEDQISKYCQLAKLNGIDAVITISNQFAALPTHHPLKMSKKATSGIDVYHWSWMYALTQAKLLLGDDNFKSEEQKYILQEAVRYLDHPSIGISSFDRMNSEWKDIVSKIKSGAQLNKNSEDVEKSVAAWHQEQRDLCLKLSEDLKCYVAIKLSRSHKSDPGQRLADDCQELVKNHRLLSELEIPDTASPMQVVVDVGKRTVACSMKVDAPKDKKQNRSKVNWILKQLPDENSNEIFVKASWPGRVSNTQEELSKLKNDPDLLAKDHPSHILQGFEVILVRDLVGKFAGQKTFIEEFEKTVEDFYDQVGQRLQNWIAPPPKMEKESEQPTEQGKVQEQPKIEETQDSSPEEERRTEEVWPFPIKEESALDTIQGEEMPVELPMEGSPKATGE
ncbi:hypothetical protein [Nitrospina watsonii]|uniref:Stress response protein n=1 Tax=Nitrospina watsonii TaxID=1323948 RepID=A0ABM9HB99_9BACT|nr:hypothetical protein [Nitrospina watsonii]CAI2717401.1 conserved protein of unknown function [Nitrospina watsonii]